MKTRFKRIFMALLFGITVASGAGIKYNSHALDMSHSTDKPVVQPEQTEALAIENMTVEFKTNPLGIDEPNPLFGYKIVGGERGTVQTRYLIQVSTNDKSWTGDNIVWSSGTVDSNKNSSIKYDGNHLSGRTKYYWRVTATFNNGQKLTSPVASFETGTMQEDWTRPEWNGAMWITPVKPAGITSYNVEVDFRIEKDALGIIFGYDSNSELNLWQINLTEAKDSQKVLLRPHKKVNGNYALEGGNIDISSAIAWSRRFDEHHMKIEVRDNKATTYINSVKFGPTALVTRDYGTVGLRVSNDNEIGAARNFKITSVDGTETYLDVEITKESNTFEHPDASVVDSGDGSGLWVRMATAASDQIAVAGTVSNTAYLRKDFTTTAALTVKSARLYAAAQGVYDAYINGARVSEDYLAPGWTDYWNRTQYQTYDVTNMLNGNGGNNALGMVLSGGWYSGELSYLGPGRYDSKDAAFACLDITYSDGSKQYVVSDESWKSTKNTPYVFTGILGGERYDASKEHGGSPFAWSNPAVYGSGELTGENKWGDAARYTRAKERGRTLEQMRLVAQIDPPVRETMTIAAQAVTQSDGKYIVDFGQNFAGVVRIKLSGVRGQKVTLRHGEITSDNSKKEQDVGPLGSLYTANLRGDYARDSYTFARAETVTYQPRLTFHGFRYLEITGLHYRPAIEDITGVVLNSDLSRTGWYETSNAEITNQIYHNQYWGQVGNFLSIPTDCPQRNERMGWTGDAMIFNDTATYNMDTYNFYRKFMIDFRDSQHRPDNPIGNNDLLYGANVNYAPYAERGLPSEDPRIGRAGNHGDIIWSAASVTIPYNLYTAYGDTRILEENYSSIYQWYEYLQRVTKAAGGSGNRGISENLLYTAQVHHGDWVAVEVSDRGLVGNAYLAFTYDLMARIADALGKTADKQMFENSFEETKAAYIKKYVKNDMHVYSDRRIAPDADNMSSSTQCSLLLTLAFNLVPGNTPQEVAVNEEKMIQHLLNDIGKETNIKGEGTMTLGFTSIRFLNIVLSEKGKNNMAYHMVQNTNYPSWGYSVNNGATTIWERWDSYSDNGYQNVGMNSFNHYSFGSVGEWMYKYSAGISTDLTKAGYENAIIRPYLDASMSYVKGAYDTVRGIIYSEWSIDEKTGKVTFKITIPTNSTATVIIPASGLDVITENGAAVTADTSGVDSIVMNGANAVINIGSGTYIFVVG